MLTSCETFTIKFPAKVEFGRGLCGVYYNKLSSTLGNVQRGLQDFVSRLDDCFTWFDPFSL